MIRRLTRLSPILPAPGFLAFILAALLLFTQSPLPAADQKSIADAIAQLSDPDPRIRDQASKTLWQLGREAEPAILEAIKGDDPEIVARCRDILIDFKYGIYPDTPRDIVSLIQTYRRGNPVQKRAAVQGLARIGPRAFPAAVRLSRAEDNYTLRSQVFHELAQMGARGAIGFLAEGDFTSAEQCLEVGLSDGMDRQTRSYIAFLLLRGRDDQKIAALRAEMELGDGISGAARLLAYLLRAKGDLAGAREAAEQSHDDRLLEGIILEQADFKTLASRHANEGENDHNLEKLGFRAACQRLAGQSDAAAHTLELIATAPPRRPDNPWPAAKALLLNDRPNQAIALLLAQKETNSALELLLAQQRYPEAIDLAATAKESKSIILARIARTWHLLGEKEKSAAALRNAINLAPQTGMPAWIAIVDAQLRTGQRQSALDQASDAINQLNDLPDQLFEKLFPKNSSDAQSWWPILRARHPDESPAQTMTRLDTLLSGKWPPDELTTLTREIREGKLTDLTNRQRVLRAAVNALQKAGLAQESQACSLALAQFTNEERDLVSLAAAAIVKKDWNSAAELSIRAIEKDRSRAAPRYFRGYSLLQLGREKEGHELIDIARLLPLADDPDRYEFAEHLQKAGLADAAHEQYQLLLRVGDFSTWEVGNATRIMAHRASEQGDDLAAAALWERSTLPCLRENTGFIDVAAYLGIPHLIHRTRARGLIKSGKLDAALAELRLCEEYLPGDIALPIEMATPLRDAGREKDLTLLVDRILQRQESLLTTYPKAAMIHNSAAWLLARCRLKLDVALAHAQKAADLEPQNAPILDTLAETYFQLGQKDKAISIIRTCIDLEPTIDRHKAQLTRFQHSSPTSLPPS
ncbi:MAG TPA: tetratricopeptide repeat protein [Tepidisphaeraceae bacterium]|nr:tetratricopeptide repeat protein [Tepidisphaeraceae bacterium]